MEMYDIEFVGNDDFEMLTRTYGWENSDQNASGSDMPPEWSDEVAAIWRDGEQFYDPEDWNEAMETMARWRSGYGMQPYQESNPVILDETLWASCSDTTAAINEEYAETVAILSAMNQAENFYPPLDNMTIWIDEQFEAKAAEEAANQAEQWEEMENSTDSTTEQ